MWITLADCGWNCALSWLVSIFNSNVKITYLARIKCAFQMLNKSQQETPVTVGRPVTHQQSVNTTVSSSADQVGLTPLSGFGLSSHPSPGPTVVTSQPQMQIPQDLVMKLLQLQQVCQICPVFCCEHVCFWTPLSQNK